MARLAILTTFLLCLAALLSSIAHVAEGSGDWRPTLEAEIERIDASTEGNLGVYVKNLGDGRVMSVRSDRPWYLASTTKVPVAIVLLQKREEGMIDLEREVTVNKSDFVDGAGDVNWLEPGSRIKIGALLEKMLTQSDSTAADLLIRTIGVEDLNRRLRRIAGNGFHSITTLLQVRYDAYGELHPSMAKLSNLDFFEVKKRVGEEERLKFLMSRTGIARDELKVQSIPKAFEEYYEGLKNSGTLIAFGELLENLVRGRILSHRDTELLLKYMEAMKTGEGRLKAGFPKSVRFAQKTGTQLGRICNVGVARKATPRDEDVVVAACLERFADQKDGEATLARAGAAISHALRFE